MAKIFISYRREDSEWQAHEIYTAIKKRLGNTVEEIFIDIDHIPLGVNFQVHIDAKVAECDVMLALIGRDWFKGSQPGRPANGGWINRTISSGSRSPLR